MQKTYLLGGGLPSNVFWKPGHEFNLSSWIMKGDALEGNADSGDCKFGEITDKP